MGILHVEDRILAGLFHGQIQIEVQVAFGTAVQEEEAGRILPHLVHQILHGDELTGPFGHFHGLAILSRATYCRISTSKVSAPYPRAWMAAFILPIYP